jgi:YfiR/HmsC-like
MARKVPSKLLCGRRARRIAPVFRCAQLVVLLAVWIPNIVAQARPSEFDVEAAYLFNFGKFMRLSEGSQALRRTTFDICILGRDPIGRTIDELASNETIDNRPVRIVRIADVSRARTCDVVFIGTRDRDSIREDLAILAGSDTLTVGDSEDFLEEGGMIQFLVEREHVRFAVNLNAVRKTHLVLSSQLLRVAAYVMGKPKAGGAS